MKRIIFKYHEHQQTHFHIHYRVCTILKMFIESVCVCNDKNIDSICIGIVAVCPFFMSLLYFFTTFTGSTIAFVLCSIIQYAVAGEKRNLFKIKIIYIIILRLRKTKNENKCKLICFFFFHKL